MSGGSAKLPYVSYVFNRRGILSFVDAVEIFLGKNSYSNSDIEGLEVLSDVDPLTMQVKDGSHLQTYEEFGEYDDWRDAEIKVGYHEHISDMVGYMVDVYSGMLDYERQSFGSVSLATRVLDDISAQTQSLYETVQMNNAGSDAWNDALSAIQSDPDYAFASFLALTKDHMMLMRALYDSFSVQNREYPYLPASKALMTNQSKNLAAFMKEEDLLVGGGVNSESSNQKYILPVGIPSGMIEALRKRMMDETGDVDYRDSNIIEIAVWKRDLKNQSRLYDPVRYVFDTSRFIISGRSESTNIETDTIDGDYESPDPQTFSEICKNTVVRKYDPSGNTESITGAAYEDPFSNTSIGVNSYSIFINHVYDHYLKLYMRLTTGIDVSEDIFPFLEENVLFEGPDPDKEDIFSTLSNQAKEMFVDRDIEAALNYDRLVGELTRSIILSPQKYRNRILYPKAFERVFCVLLDPSSFVQVSGDDKPDSEDDYIQYYVTTKILPPETNDYWLKTNTGDMEIEIQEDLAGIKSPNTALVINSLNSEV